MYSEQPGQNLYYNTVKILNKIKEVTYLAWLRYLTKWKYPNQADNSEENEIIKKQGGKN